MTDLTSAAMPSHLTTISDEAKAIAALLAGAGNIDVAGITVRDQLGAEWYLAPDGEPRSTGRSAGWADGRADILYQRGNECFRIELTEVPF